MWRDRGGPRPAGGGDTEGTTCWEFWRGWKAAHDVPRTATAEAAAAEMRFIANNRRTRESSFVRSNDAQVLPLVFALPRSLLTPRASGLILTSTKAVWRTPARQARLAQSGPIVVPKTLPVRLQQ